MVKLIRQSAITVFCIFHFLSISWWAFPNSFEGYVLQQGATTGWFYKLEKRFFEWHREIRGNPVFSIVEGYIDLIGAYQYWDFFAPQAPDIAHFLTVCSNIEPITATKEIHCADKAVYTSYDGALEGAIQSHRGHRSRSFRFAENLVQMDQQWLDQFLKHWVRFLPANHPDGQIIYLIDDQLIYQSDQSGMPLEYSRSSSILAFDLVDTRYD